MKKCQPRKVLHTLTSSTEGKNLVNPNIGQTLFLQKFDLLGFSRLQNGATILFNLQCFFIFLKNSITFQERLLVHTL